MSAITAMVLPDSVKVLFYQTLLDIMLHLDFDRIGKAVQATKFGWARFIADTGPDAYVEFVRRAKKMAENVATSALIDAVEHNETRSISSGGFEALVEPTGRILEIKFVLTSWDTYMLDEEDEDDDTAETTDESVTAES